MSSPSLLYPRARCMVALVAVAVICTALVVISVAVRNGRSGGHREQGVLACQKLMQHSGTFTSSELAYYSEAFRTTSHQDLSTAGLKWVSAEDSGTNFSRTATLALVAKECSRVSP
jgi:hypothetical protein